jgi:uncharacterized glyoxalase superfamily protein PhnB
MFRYTAPVLETDDVENAVLWYTENLAFSVEQIHRDPDGQHATNYAVLRRDGVTIHLVLRAERDLPVAGRVETMIVVADVNSLFDTICKLDIDVVRRLADRPWGHRDFTILDPDGNALWFSQPGTGFEN